MTGRRAVMVRVWDRDAVLDPADLVGRREAWGLAVLVRDKGRGKDRERDLPEVVRVDPAFLANSIAVRAFDIRRGTADD